MKLKENRNQYDGDKFVPVHVKSHNVPIYFIPQVAHREYIIFTADNTSFYRSWQKTLTECQT